MKEMEVTAGRCVLFAVLEGKGSALLFLHGQLGIHAVVRPLVSALTDQWQVITPDVRGRGRSRCPYPEEHTWDAYADDVVAILDALDVEKGVIGGVSLGAGIALRTAIRHPIRVEALVLHSSVYAGQEIGWSAKQKIIQSQVIEAAEVVVSDAPKKSNTVASPKWARHDPMSLAAAIIGLGYSQPFESVRELEPVSVPVMIVPGRDALHPRQVAQLYAKTMPKATWAEPAVSEFPSALRDFLNSVV